MYSGKWGSGITLSTIKDLLCQKGSRAQRSPNHDLHVCDGTILGLLVDKDGVTPYLGCDLVLILRARGVSFRLSRPSHTEMGILTPCLRRVTQHSTKTIMDDERQSTKQMAVFAP